MRKFLTIALFAAIALTSCRPAQTYDNHGLSFTYPGGWEITADEFANSRGYLSIEKSGSKPTASIIFGWMEIEANIASDMMFTDIFQQMKINDGLTDLVQEPAQEANYGNYPARAVTYTAKIDGTDVTGAVWVFTAQGRVVNVAVREGAQKANVEVFRKIKNSFELK